MIGTFPFSTWPLHVKLFTDEAVKLWESLDKDAALAPLPSGLTVNIELEGVDGKSGMLGSGRSGPIDVTDGNVLIPCHLTMHLIT